MNGEHGCLINDGAGEQSLDRAALLTKLRDYELLERCAVPALDEHDVLSIMDTVRELFTDRFTFDRFGILVGTVNDKFCIIHEIVTHDDMTASPLGGLMIIKATGLEKVYTTQKLHYNPDINARPEFIEDSELASFGIRSLVRVPLVYKEQVLGVMTVKSVNPHHYSQWDLQVMAYAANRLATCIYSLRLIYALKESAYKDALTNVMNRRFLGEISAGNSALIEEMTGLTFKDSPDVALLFIDVDDFKSFNDCYGHIVGDGRLCDVASMLCEIVDDRGFVIRFGGDEFLVILPDSTVVDAYAFAREVRLSVLAYNRGKKPSDLEYPLGLSVGASVGIWDNFETLLGHADMDMYADKDKMDANFVHHVL